MTVSEPVDDSQRGGEKKNHRVIPVLVILVLLGLVYGVYRMFTWNPNYVDQVVHADEFLLKSGEGVMLIGVDCPPVQDERVGKPAVGFTSSCILHRYVTIETDDKEKNDAGWILGYVFFEKDGKQLFLNEELLRRGFGRKNPVAPNLTYRERLAAAEAEAKKNKLGVWSPTEEEPPIP